jgi:hypothetical protein
MSKPHLSHVSPEELEILELLRTVSPEARNMMIAAIRGISGVEIKEAQPQGLRLVPGRRAIDWTLNAVVALAQPPDRQGPH